ncbi:unc-80-like protein [Moniliophthora roreri]|nr:unc-80-like protein [Moniliophthora roreri]
MVELRSANTSAHYPNNGVHLITLLPSLFLSAVQMMAVIPKAKVRTLEFFRRFPVRVKPSKTRTSAAV